MNRQQLTPAAEIILNAYTETAVFSRQFRDDHDGYPATALAKAHHMRSVIQWDFDRSDRFKLGSKYLQAGRVEFYDSEDGTTYLLRSTKAVAIEGSTGGERLFDPNQMLRSDVILVVYEFTDNGLQLALAGTRFVGDTARLVATGTASPVGEWTHQAFHSGPAFDQVLDVNPFAELGNSVDLDRDADIQP